ncbi:hypothetical protein ACLI4R_04015 [Natrialbaceae archaeon A-chndr2]
MTDLESVSDRSTPPRAMVTWSVEVRACVRSRARDEVATLAASTLTRVFSENEGPRRSRSTSDPRV